MKTREWLQYAIYSMLARSTLCAWSAMKSGSICPSLYMDRKGGEGTCVSPHTLIAFAKTITVAAGSEMCYPPKSAWSSPVLMAFCLCLLHECRETLREFRRRCSFQEPLLPHLSKDASQLFQNNRVSLSATRKSLRGQAHGYDLSSVWAHTGLNKWSWASLFKPLPSPKTPLSSA